MAKSIFNFGKDAQKEQEANENNLKLVYFGKAKFGANTGDPYFDIAEVGEPNEKGEHEFNYNQRYVAFICTNGRDIKIMEKTDWQQKAKERAKKEQQIAAGIREVGE